jgi:hypothetical protein
LIARLIVAILREANDPCRAKKSIAFLSNATPAEDDFELAIGK